jgi:hypothetical protein
MGTRKVDRHVGIVQITVLVPQRSGTALANTLAEFSGKVFRATHAALSDGANVTFRTPQFTSTGQQLGFFPIVVRIPYWRDEAPQ